MKTAWEERWIENWKIKLIEKDYPIPELVMTQYGYEKAKCPECGDLTLLRGYSLHIKRKHRENNYKSWKGIKYGHYEIRDRKAELPEDRRPSSREIQTVNEIAWEKRSKKSMANILKKYS